MSEYFIYLIEEPGAALDAVKKYHDDLMVEKTKWRTWAQDNFPEAEGVSVDKEGYCWGVKFPIGKLPDNWRKPDRKTGLSWPRVNNPIRETMPENNWKNILPGCRLIRGYEWDYLCKKHKEQKNDTV